MPMIYSSALDMDTDDTTNQVSVGGPKAQNWFPQPITPQAFDAYNKGYKKGSQNGYETGYVLGYKAALNEKAVEEHQAETSWEDKFKALEEKFNKELAKEKRKVSQMKLEIHNKDEQIQSLTQIKDNLCQSLDEKTAELSQKQAIWQEKLEALEDRFAKDQAAKQQALELQIQHKDTEIACFIQSKKLLLQSLEEKTSQLDKITAELSQKQTTWQEERETLERKFTVNLAEVEQTWDTKLQQSNSNVSEWRLKHQQVEDKNKDMTEKIQGLETTAQQMQDEINLLEEICLYQKSRRGISIFRRQILNREAALERMKSKMKDKMKRR